MIELKVNGKSYTKFVDLELSRDIDNACGSLTFSTSKKKVDIKANDIIQAVVDGTTMFTGRIDGVSNSIGDADLAQSFTARDYLADLVDSSLPDSCKRFKTGTSLLTLINEVVKALNMTLTVQNLAGTITPFSSIEKVAGEAGQNAFEFITSYARKRQVFINSNGQGNIKLYKLNGLLGANFDFENSGAKKNILSANGQINLADRYYSYACKSQINFKNASGDSGDYNRVGRATDTDVRNSRYYEFTSEQSMTQEECKKRAEEEANIRRARSFSYNVTASGHSQNGTVFDIAKGARINDEILDVKGVLMIKSFSMKVSESDGETTEMTLTYPDAYSVEASIAQKSQKRLDINSYLNK